MQVNLGRYMTLGMRWPSAAETIHKGVYKSCLYHTQKQQALCGRILHWISVHYTVDAVSSTEALMASLLGHGKYSVWR